LYLSATLNNYKSTLMKKVLIAVFTFVLALQVQAQIETPAPSPFQTIEQKVGLTDVEVEYSRPSMKGRTIMGGLVPYNKIWRTGANARTKITFSDDVMVDGQELKAGTYAILTKPTAKNWEVYFYTDYAGGGAPQELDDSKVAAKTTVPVYPLPMDIETFTMSFDDLTNESANLGMMWEKTYVSVPVSVPTDKMVSAAIDRVMNGPTANDYYASAVYKLEAGKDIDQAKKWIDKSMEMTKEPAFWQLRQKSLIYAKSGDKEGAIKAAKKSLELAKAAGNDDYIALNTKSLKEWGAM